MKIPVILLNYNSSSDCQKCVSFLQKQRGVELEIIIVDNCSRGDEREKVEILCKEQSYTFIPANENRGYNAGNNIGLRYAASKGYKYALIANPDMEFPQTDYLQKISDSMEKDEEIVVCGSDIITPEGKHQNPMREMTYWEELFWFITYFKYSKNSDWFISNHKVSHICEKISGCCFLIRINYLESHGFFDENVFLYCEEAILAKQIKNKHKKIYYLANIQAIHFHVKKEKGDPKKRLMALFKSREYYLRNYSGYNKIQLYMLLISKRIQKMFLLS